MTYNYLVKSDKDLPHALRNNGGAQRIDPDIPRVSIYCRAESHSDHPWFVASFIRQGDGTWAESGVYPMADGLGFDHRATAATLLAGDVVVDPHDIAALRKGGLRVRAKYECGECGFASTTKSATLTPIFDTLWEYDIRELDLRSLAARLSKHR